MRIQGPPPPASSLRPLRLFLTLVATTLVAEFVVMLVLALLPKLSTGWTAVLDSVLLTVIVVPLWYLLLVRPLERHSARVMESATAREGTISRQDALLAAVGDPVVMIDEDGMVTFWNPAAERVTGFRVSEVLGRDLHEFLAPERYRSAFRQALPEFQRTGKGAAIGKTLEVAALRKDGSEIPVLLSLATFRLGGKWRAGGVFRDITAELNARAEVIRAKEAAEASARAKADFLANMSHEVRTPMNGIIGMSGLLLDTPLEPEQRTYAEMISSSSQSLLRIVNDILDFSKVDAGRLDIEIMDFDLRALMEEIGAGMARRAEEKGLEMVSIIDPETPSLVRGDPGRIRQVLTNLIANALKFTSRGQIIVQVSLMGIQDESATLRFSVTDTGIGIPADRIPYLFEPFTQADESTTRRFGGTGLGLSIAKQLAELMGGEIGAESTEGKGSTFWFTTVLERQPAGTAADYQMASEESLAGVRCLAVDRDAANRLLLEKLLTRWGLRCEVAEDGEEALTLLQAAAAESDPFRVALFDRDTEGMDGETLGRRVRKDPALADTHLVLLSSAGQRGDAELFRGRGFSAYLTKPVRPPLLHDALLAILTSASAAEPTRIITGHSVEESRRRQVRILLVEDEAVSRLLVVKTIERLGYTVDQATSGAEALEKVESTRYDLVLMDVAMPEMSGLEATRRIRAGGSSVLDPEVPIVAITAHALEGDRDECLAAGMNDYLAKPIDLADLVAVVERHLEGRRSIRPTGPSASGPSPEAIFDRAGMLGRTEGDAELLRAILQIFLQEAPRQIGALESALAGGDEEKIRVAAHSLKGSAGSVGAVVIGKIAARAEAAANSGDPSAAESDIRGIAEAFAEFRRIAENEVRATGDGPGGES